jgi:hypothetical protein
MRRLKCIQTMFTVQDSLSWDWMLIGQRCQSLNARFNNCPIWIHLSASGHFGFSQTRGKEAEDLVSVFCIQSQAAGRDQYSWIWCPNHYKATVPTSKRVFSASQMAPHPLYTALLLTRAYRAPVKSSELFREKGAMWYTTQFKDPGKPNICFKLL